MKIIQSILVNNDCYKVGKKIPVAGLMLHSVGCSQPSAMVFINQWNKSGVQKAVHGFIEPNGDVYQTLPFDHRGWHGGGTSNNTHLGFEMTDPSTIKYTGNGAEWTDLDPVKTKAHVLATYKFAVELFAKLCTDLKLDPLGKNVIISHAEGHKLGIASGHADPEHLWKKFGLTMNQFRLDVKNAMLPINKPVVTIGVSIVGKSQCTAEQLETYLLTNNTTPKIKMAVKEFCKLWITEGEIEGIKGDVAFCQAVHETGFFKYGGLVLEEQNNFGGIGATNNSAKGKGAWFETPQMGIQANIQHLKAYGSKEPLKQACVDPRFHLVTRGIAPNFEDLGGRWAVPGFDKVKYKSLDDAKAAGETYGHTILKKYEALKQVKVPESKYPAELSDWAKTGYDFVIENNISDGSDPKGFITREEFWTILFNYHSMKD